VQQGKGRGKDRNADHAGLRDTRRYPQVANRHLSARTRRGTQV